MQQPRPSSPRPTMQQPRHNSPRPAMQQPRHNSPRPAMQQPKPVSQRQTVQRAKPVSQRQTMHQPKHAEVSREKLRPKAHDSQQNVARPKVHNPKQDAVKATIQQPKHTEVIREKLRPKAHGPKQSVPRPKIYEQRQEVSKPKAHKPEYRKHSKPGPRKDLHRPPVQRTYENMHVWRRAPKPPKDHWWNHRPAYRRSRYRGYYNGTYYTDVLSALLVAEIIHYDYITEPVNTVYYAEDATRALIPKEAIKYKGHHYLVFSDIGNTMEDAQQFCESMGGHLAEVGDDKMNERMYRLINDSGYDNEYFEKFGHYRMIPNEPVTYVKADQESNSEEEVFYGLYYWNYKNLTEDGTTDGTGGNAFVCEWDK